MKRIFVQLEMEFIMAANEKTITLTTEEHQMVQYALDMRRQQLARAANAAPTGSNAKKGFVADLDAFELTMLKFR